MTEVRHIGITDNRVGERTLVNCLLSAAYANEEDDAFDIAIRDIRTEGGNVTTETVKILTDFLPIMYFS